ncbi:hypothetical protein Droror1_Dr00010642 [Drosera rotundifolia]
MHDVHSRHPLASPPPKSLASATLYLNPSNSEEYNSKPISNYSITLPQTHRSPPMARPEFIIIPLPGMGHLIPAVELATRLVSRDERVAVSLLIMTSTFDQISSYIQSLHQTFTATGDRVHVVQLPGPQERPDPASKSFMPDMLQNYKPIVKKAAEDLAKNVQLMGLILDPFCSDYISIAHELQIPTYIFFTSGAAFLSLMLHFQSLRDDHKVDLKELTSDPDGDVEIPGFKNRVPNKVLPPLFQLDSMADFFLNHSMRFRKTRGIIVNTSEELESYPIQILSNDPKIPPIYPAGPIINQNARKGAEAGPDGNNASIMGWLDDQPPGSVVFLCFGSMGSFNEEQVREVAKALEKSGHRFLWALRRPPSASERFEPPSEYDDLSDVLPEGFLDRTTSIGKIIGWAPQVQILSHPAVGCFVSHCGWNSTLEGLSLGVPIAAWPMYAEQQANAFELVKEMGMAVEVRMDYTWDHRKKSSNFIVQSDEIEKAIREIMDEKSPVRKKVKEIAESNRKATAEGGSTYTALGRFIDDAFKNIQ